MKNALLLLSIPKAAPVLWTWTKFRNPGMTGIDSWREAPADILKTTFIRAANEAQQRLEKAVEQGGAIAIESVLSTRKYCRVVERVLELEGKFMLIYLMLNSPKISERRVRRRVLQEGHDVPLEKLEPRWRDSLGLLPWFAARATRFWILDNSDDLMPDNPQPVVSGNEHALTVYSVPPNSVREPLSNIVTEHAARERNSRWCFAFSANVTA